MGPFRTGQRVRVAAWDRMKQGIADWHDSELVPVGTEGTVHGNGVVFDNGARWPLNGTHILELVEDEKMRASSDGSLLDFLKGVVSAHLPAETGGCIEDFDFGRLTVCRSILREHFKIEADFGVVFKEVT